MKKTSTRDVLLRAFEVAGIDYGRADFSIVDGVPQIYEINTNPKHGSRAVLVNETHPDRLRTQLQADDVLRQSILSVATPDHGPIAITDPHLRRQQGWWGRLRRAGAPVILLAASDFDFRSGEYRELLIASNATAFQHPDWLEPFYRIFVPAHEVESLVVIGRNECSGRLDLVLPLIRSVTSVDYAFLDVTDYACPVLRTGVQVADKLPAELRAVTGEEL